MRVAYLRVVFACGLPESGSVTGSRVQLAEQCFHGVVTVQRLALLQAPFAWNLAARIPRVVSMVTVVSRMARVNGRGRRQSLELAILLDYPPTEFVSYLR